MTVPERAGPLVANGVAFHLLRWGSADAPLALLLHGFPDHAPTWRYLGPRLAAAGFRVVAPWLRGYAPTGLAPDDRYDPEVLGADANALHEDLGGRGDAVLVGHDWGALAAHRAAAAAPERWRQVVTLAVPPEPVLAAAGLDLEQLLRRSWYTALFQVPGSARLALARDQALIDLLWRRWSPGYGRDPEDAAALRATLGAPGVMRAALRYYRGARDLVLARRFPDPAVVAGQPTLHLHGRDDGCIAARFADRTRPHLSAGSRVEVLDGVGHFLHLEQPDLVGDLIVDALG